MKTSTLKPSHNLLEALDFEGLSETEQEELLIDLNSLIFRGSLVRLIERMDEETKDDFDALMEKNADEDEVLEFLEKRVPGADGAVAETIEDLTSDILAVTG
jgi:hypothetical protein